MLIVSWLTITSTITLVGGVKGYVIVFDEKHTLNGSLANHISPLKSYSILVDMLEASGYIVKSLNTTLTYEALKNITVLVLPPPTVKYTVQEIEALDMWVKEGGSLLVLAEWGNFSTYLEDVVAVFNVKVKSVDNNDVIVDPENSLTLNNMPYNVWFYIGRSQLNTTSPILSGVSRLEFYGATTLDFEKGSALAFTSNNAKWLYSGDVEGREPLIVALEYGKGRVVIIGDSDIFSNEDLDGDGEVNLFDSDNEILALNIFSWLTFQRSYMEEVTLTVTVTEKMPSEYIETVTETVNQTVTQVETVREYSTITKTTVGISETTVTETSIKVEITTETTTIHVPQTETTTTTVTLREVEIPAYTYLFIALTVMLVLALIYVIAKSRVKI